MSGCVLFYVQHLLGIGHVQRAFRLADAVAREGIAVTLVSGGEPPPGSICEQSARIVQLAPIRARDASFKELVGPCGRPIDEKLREARRGALLAAFEAAKTGTLPPPPNFEAATHASYRGKLSKLVAAAEAGDIAALQAIEINPCSTSPKAMERYRNIVLVALAARAQPAA